MLLWIIFALMTSAVLVAVLAPLARAAAPQPAANSGSLEVYRDQLEEIEAERTRGMVDPAEADAARIEISRRLLASAARPEPPASSLADIEGDTLAKLRESLNTAMAMRPIQGGQALACRNRRCCSRVMGSFLNRPGPASGLGSTPTTGSPR